MERFGIPIGWNREYFKRTKVPNGISKWPLWAPMKQYKKANKLLNENQIKAAIPYINWFVISVFCTDMIFVTSSTSSASVKYFWVWVKLYRINMLTTL